MNLNHYITEQKKPINKVLKQLKSQYGVYLDRIRHFLEIDEDEYCNLLTSIYFPLFAYKFLPTLQKKSYYDIMVNGDIIIYICHTTLDLPLIQPSIEENKVFIELIKLINAALTLIQNIDKLHMDLSYLMSAPLKQYMADNIESLGMKAGNEMTLRGGTKIDGLYATVFGPDSKEHKEVTELMKKHTNDLHMGMNEEYFTREGRTEIFLNPNRKEMKEAIEEGTDYCRYMVDLKEQNVYVWRAGFLHAQASTLLKHSGVPNKYVYPAIDRGYLWGRAQLKGDKLVSLFYELDNFIESYEIKERKDLLKKMAFTKHCFGTSMLDRIQQYLKDFGIDEEYVAMDGEMEIFKNPTKEEMKETCQHDNTCRYMIDVKKKDIYVWTYKYLHADASKLLKSEGIENRYPYPHIDKDYIWAIARLKDKKLETLQYDLDKHIRKCGIEREDLAKMLDFTKHWFGSSILERVKYAEPLQEEYYGLADTKYSHRQAAIYKNPTLKELKQASEDGFYRFMVDVVNKDLYLWDSSFLHEYAHDWFKRHGIPCAYPYSNNNMFLWGEGKRDGGRLVCRDLYYSESQARQMKRAEVDNFIEKTYGFLKYWFGDSFEDRVKRTIEYWISEESIGYAKNIHVKGDYEVFKNPNIKEIRECTQREIYCRFMIDTNNRDFYCWNYNLLHEYVHQWLKTQGVETIYPSWRNNDFIWGVAEYKEGRLQCTSNFSFDVQKFFQLPHATIKEQISKEFKFTRKWLGDTLIDRALVRMGYLSEAFEKSIEGLHYGKRIVSEIFVNPTLKELKDACKSSPDTPGAGFHMAECRFAIDVKGEKFYAWNYNLLHHVVAKDYGWDYPDEANNFIYGAAALHGSKLGEIIFMDLRKPRGKAVDKLKKLVKWTRSWFGDTLESWMESNFKVKLD